MCKHLHRKYLQILSKIYQRYSVKGNVSRIVQKFDEITLVGKLCCKLVLIWVSRVRNVGFHRYLRSIILLSLKSTYEVWDTYLNFDSKKRRLISFWTGVTLCVWMNCPDNWKVFILGEPCTCSIFSVLRRECNLTFRKALGMKFGGEPMKWRQLQFKLCEPRLRLCFISQHSIGFDWCLCLSLCLL